MRKDNEAQRADGNKGGTTIRVFDIYIIRAPGLKSTLGVFICLISLLTVKDHIFL